MAGLPAFDRQHTVERLRDPLRIFDAMGLALFAVYGTGKALAFGLGPVNAPLLGRLGGIGGGIVRNLRWRCRPSCTRRRREPTGSGAGQLPSGDCHAPSRPMRRDACARQP
ncbi:putative membrane protein YeiH [Xanthomonas sacchari]|nr:putative membrane protein YeiH [Xanthomonas sacchari]